MYVYKYRQATNISLFINIDSYSQDCLMLIVTSNDGFWYDFTIADELNTQSFNLALKC
jgi:hypothetical protein